ncbi:uncharacterized protein [Dermacentor albipictus]|uniref:uncharacterized protein isoform X2 n=1 Tax=Dermacentor albipictus TaxID=60249 RepID=UPI0031FE0A28
MRFPIDHRLPSNPVVAMVIAKQRRPLEKAVQDQNGGDYDHYEDSNSGENTEGNGQSAQPKLKRPQSGSGGDYDKIPDDATGAGSKSLYSGTIFGLPDGPELACQPELLRAASERRRQRRRKSPVAPAAGAASGRSGLETSCTLATVAIMDASRTAVVSALVWPAHSQSMCHSVDLFDLCPQALQESV